MPKTPSSSFDERFAYARWAAMRDEDDKALAKRVGLSAAWVAKWKVRRDAPPGRKEGPALARGLGVTEEWLLDDDGEPPRPNDWPAWLAQRRASPPKRVAMDREEGARKHLAQKKAAKKAAKGQRA